MMTTIIIRRRVLNLNSNVLQLTDYETGANDVMRGGLIVGQCLGQSVEFPRSQIVSQSSVDSIQK